MFRIIYVLVFLGCFSMSAQAASVSYIMNMSNPELSLVDSNFLEVTINDDNADVSFTVRLLDALLDIADTDFGIESFGFNLLGVTLATTDIILEPSGWGVTLDTDQDIFGNFGVVLAGDVDTRQDPSLTFSITNHDDDSIASYYALSSGNGNSNTYFASHVAGFENQDSLGDLTSAFFGGGTFIDGGGTPPQVPQVPVPAAIWLFGTALIGFIGISRRTAV